MVTITILSSKEWKESSNFLMLMEQNSELERIGGGPDETVRRESHSEHQISKNYLFKNETVGWYTWHEFPERNSRRKMFHWITPSALLLWIRLLLTVLSVACKLHYLSIPQTFVVINTFTSAIHFNLLSFAMQLLNKDTLACSGYDSWGSHVVAIIK